MPVVRNSEALDLWATGAEIRRLAAAGIAGRAWVEAAASPAAVAASYVDLIRRTLG